MWSLPLLAALLVTAIPVTLGNTCAKTTVYRLTDGTNYLKSLNYGNQSEGKTDCVYTVIGKDTKQALQYQLLRFRVNDSHQNCHENYLEIYDGSRKENSLIQKICPGDTVQEGTALGHQMQIVHKEKNKNGQNQGFQIRIWQVVLGPSTKPCPPNETYTVNETGLNLKSKLFGLEINEPINCTYKFKAENESKVLRVKFTFLHVEPDESCDNQFVDVFDGPITDGNRIAFGCNRKRPHEVVSTGNYVEIHYQANRQPLWGGFNVTVTAEEPKREVCPTNMYWYIGYEQKHWSSFKYGQKVDSPINCTYTIAAKNRKRSLEYVISKFKVGKKMDNCTGEYVAIYEGFVQQNELKQKLCGDYEDVKELELVTLGHQMQIRQVANKQNQDEGIRLLVWPVVLGKSPRPCPLNETYTVNETGLKLKSKLFGLEINEPINCTYKFKAENESKVLRVKFTFLHVEPDESCDNQFVDVFDGPITDGNRIAFGCNRKRPHEVVSTGNYVEIHYQANRQPLWGGFNVTVTAEEPKREVCPTNMYWYIGYEQKHWSSFKYGQKVDSPINCTYTIAAKNRKRSLEYVISKFKVGKKMDNCTGEYVAIYEGFVQQNELKQKLCGDYEDVKELELVTLGHQMQIRQVANKQNQDEGIRLLVWPVVIGMHEGACLPNASYTVSGSGLTVKSHRFGLEMNFPMKCVYKFNASNSSKVLRVEFDYFRSAYSKFCDQDKVAVYDGEVSEGKSIAVGCGRLKPPTVLSNGSYVEIYYKVRRQPYRGGFNVTVTEVDPNSEA